MYTQIPKYKVLNDSSNMGGAPILQKIWNKFGFSFLLTQCGIFKEKGLATWTLAFAYVLGLINKKFSVNEIAKFANEDPLLKIMFNGANMGQYTFSRFLTKNLNWSMFGFKRVEELQKHDETSLKDGDIIVLDDTKAEHNFGKKIPFLCWLFDSSKKAHVWCMNIVVTMAVKKNGMQYPVFNKIWLKTNSENEKKTKIELSMQMLMDIRKLTTSRLWVAMDRWFLCKDFFVFLNENNFDWVTKAKKNTALFKKVIENPSGRERYVPVNPATLIEEVYKDFQKSKNNQVSAVVIPDIYIKMPEYIENKKGKVVKKHVFKPVAAIAGIRLKEDTETKDEFNKKSGEDIDDPATYKGAYLIISNRTDAPEEAFNCYLKRWNIEVLFRTLKQELGLTKCHSTTESNHHAHFELVFAAETLLSYVRWEVNKTSVEEEFTHGEMVRILINTHCKIEYKSKKGFNSIQVYFDTKMLRFSSVLEKYWPNLLWMTYGGEKNNHLLQASA